MWGVTQETMEELRVEVQYCKNLKINDLWTNLNMKKLEHMLNMRAESEVELQA